GPTLNSLYLNVYIKRGWGDHRMIGIEAITPTDFRSRFRRGLGLILVAITAWLAAPPACRADPISYSVNGTAVRDGVTVGIGGFFGYDPTTNTLFNRNIGLIGPAPYGGQYVLDITLPAANDVPASVNGFAAPAPAVRIFFSGNLPFAEATFSSVAWAL